MFSMLKSGGVYASVGWTAYTDHPEVLRQGFENSMLTLAAYKEDQLLGIIRTVGDGYTIVFVQDILLYPEHQRKGIGTALLQAILDRYHYVRQIELATDNTEKTIAFYKAMGFREIYLMMQCLYILYTEGILQDS